jgi:hypothetical protein
MTELSQQQYVIDDFQDSADHQRPCLEVPSR